MHKYDVLIVGGGVGGASLAREISGGGTYRVAVIDKEPNLALHTSGRNSEVIHVAMSYAKDTNKAEFCNTGNEMLKEYCIQNNIPMRECGEVIVAKNDGEADEIYLLEHIARENGTKVMFLDENELNEIEPCAITHDVALRAPATAVTDSVRVTRSFAKDAIRNGAEFLFGRELVGIDNDELTAYTNLGDEIEFGCIVNWAGLHADKIAHMLGTGKEYTIIPFRGDYYTMNPEKAHLVNGCIYPVPDRRNPFLGVHFTKTILGDVIVGPTATPVFGRENYSGLEGARLDESLGILRAELELFMHDKAFRELAAVELGRNGKKAYAREARQMLRGVGADDFEVRDVVKKYAGEAGLPEYYLKYNRSGIRPQLFNRRTKSLEKDFVVKCTDDSVNVLNGISPLFTCSMPFAEYVAKEAIDRI